MKPTVVVTGMGMSTQLGEGVQVNWNQVRLADRKMGGWEDSEYGVKGFERAQILAQQVTHEALNQSQLWDSNSRLKMDPEKIGSTFSASKPLFADSSYLPSFPSADSYVSPDSVNHYLVRHFGIAGEQRTVVAACATGAYSIALGASWIEQGVCDVVLCGSVEPKPSPLYQAGFQKMGVLSHETVMRPFDSNRSGFVFGEGAGAIILESETHAQKRRAPILARLSGWGLGADTHGAVAFNSNGGKIARVIHQALAKAMLAPKEIQHINAHGTATKLNDWIEAQAIHQVFGTSDNVHVSATKSSTGHLLGAAGSVEFVILVEALRDQMIPPSKHLQTLDVTLPISISAQAISKSYNHALSLSFGFGGPIGALVISRA